MIGRLDPQKGFDLLADAAPALLDGRPARGPGQRQPGARRRLPRARRRRPDRVALIERFDRAMARRIYAGADFFLMPSRFEPSGQGQMIAMRYGTPPIVRWTGGLGRFRRRRADAPGQGTGFAFGPATPSALADACEAAIERLRSRAVRRGTAWSRGMATDFDWTTGSAPNYAGCIAVPWRSAGVVEASRQPAR